MLSQVVNSIYPLPIYTQTVDTVQTLLHCVSFGPVMGLHHIKWCAVVIDIVPIAMYRIDHGWQAL